MKSDVILSSKQNAGLPLMCPTQHDFDKNIAATRRLYVHIVGIYTYKIMYIHIYTHIYVVI